MHPFDGDDGGADPRLARLLAQPDTPASRAELLAVLGTARLFAAITATATAEETAGRTGLRAESSAEMAVVLLEAADGSRALPVFADLAGLKRWRLDARPVPLTGAQACAAALDEGAVALVVDPAGAAWQLGPGELRSLAAGWVPVAGSGLATRRADTRLGEPAEVPAGLAAALRQALAPERLCAARLLEGPDGLVLGVTPRRPLDPADLAALAARVVERLGPDLPADGLDLAQVPPSGPGRDLLRRGWLRRDR